MSKQSSELFARAQRSIPGGVNSPVRAFNGVGGDPVFFRRADGAYLWDEEGRRYIDYVGSWGPMILGHRHPRVLAAIEQALAQGLSFGAPTRIEVEMAEFLCAAMPSMEQVRMVSSGTEATMSAIRLARGFTGRDKIVKFEGCYHGHADSLLVKAGSGPLTLGVPTSPGVPADLTQHTLSLEFNNVEQVAAAFKTYGDTIACVIVEPVAGNMNCIPPLPEFLPALRALCDRYGALLIFDEVMTGFRVARGGAQVLYNIKPDLTTLGKIIGGGMPVGAFGGRADIMQYLAPTGPVYQAGTLSGNPVAMAAGLATLQLLDDDFYRELSAKTRGLMQALTDAAVAAGVPFATTNVGGMFGLFFSEEKTISRFSQAMASDVAAFKQFFHAMLHAGIYLAPSAYEAGFTSGAHSQADIEATVAAARTAFAALALTGKKKGL